MFTAEPMNRNNNATRLGEGDSVPPTEQSAQKEAGDEMLIAGLVKQHSGASGRSGSSSSNGKEKGSCDAARSAIDNEVAAVAGTTSSNSPSLPIGKLSR